MIIDKDKIDHDTEVSMIISSVESSCNPRLLSEKVTSHHKGADTFLIKTVGTTKYVEIQFQKLSELWNISLEVAKRTHNQLISLF